MIEITNQQRAAISAFLAQVRDRAEWRLEELLSFSRIWASKLQSWSVVYGVGAADTQTALWWYQYRHKPGSKEWRPSRIMQALLIASERDYAEPERLPVDDRALKVTLKDKKRARKAFIDKHGVASFYQKVKPILAMRRSGGIKGLFTAPVTPEIRDYVAILANFAKD
jgi:hypothetical protein